jgi:hypothetical protein
MTTSPMAWELSRMLSPALRRWAQMLAKARLLSSGDPFVGRSTPRVLALAGPYQPVLNYKREIVGRMQQHNRCYLCLSFEFTPEGFKPHTKMWGITWCSKCMKKYLICKFIS